MRDNKGFTLIELMIVVAIIAIIAAIAIPNLLRARLAANESSAIGSLRTLASAQSAFQSAAENDVDSDGTGEYGTLADLSNATPPFIDDALGSGQKSGYNYAVTTYASPLDEIQWDACAWPVQLHSSGNRTFFVDESGVVRGSPADAGTAAAIARALGQTYPPIGG